MFSFQDSHRLLKEAPDFRRLWLADIISNFGAWLTYVAVSLVVIEADGSSLDLALVLAAHSLPGVILAPVFGAWIDRWDGKKILLLSDFSRASLTLLMAYAAYRLDVEMLQLSLLARTAIGSLAHSANIAAVPKLVEPSQLSRANVLSSASWSASFALGVACAGLLSAVMSAHDVIILDAISFLLSALFLGRLPALPIDREISSEAQLRPGKAVISSLKEIVSLRQAVFVSGPACFVSGAAWILLNSVGGEADVWGQAALGIGFLHACRAVGTGVGPSLLAWLQGRGLSSDRAWNAAIGMILGSVAGFILLNAHWPAFLTVVGWGMGSGSLYVLSMTALQRHSPAPVRGRLVSLWSFVNQLSMCLGALLCGWLGDQLQDVNLSCGLVLGSAICFYLLIHGSPREKKPPRQVLKHSGFDSIMY